MKRRFFWGVKCIDLGHLRRLGDVAEGDMSPPPFPHASRQCHCGGRMDLDHVWPYDAATKKLVSSQELRDAWQENGYAG